MKSLIEKIGLLESSEIELNISKKEFVKKILERIESKDHYFFGIPNTNKPFYKGKIENDSFELKKKRNLLNSHLDITKISGQFCENNNKLIITSRIRIYNLQVWIGFVMIFFVYLICFISIISGNILVFENLLFDILFLFGHFILVLGLPYLIIRRIVRQAKSEFDKDLYLLFHK
jgi:hypothetical protein